MYVLIALLLLGILITIHEAGHFWAARITGIEVMEFSIGFGPKLLGWKSKKHGTDFSLRIIPVGGYCAFYGEDDAEGKHTDDPRAYSKQNVFKRMFSVIMGPGMNFVLAFVVLVGFYWLGGLETVTGYDPYISQVNAAGPAWEAGLQDGDIIESINGINMLDGTTDTLINAISNYREGDAPLHMVVRRGATTFETDATPRWDEAEGRSLIGVSITGVARTQKLPCSFGEAVQYSWNTCVNAGGLIIGALKDLVTTGAGFEETSGPVGMVSIVSADVKNYGFDAFIHYLVIISINLGIMNLLPIPGLDGSRLIFMLIEAVRRKPVPPQKEAIVHLIGMAFLLLLMVFFTFRDVLNLFR